MFTPETLLVYPLNFTSANIFITQKLNTGVPDEAKQNYYFEAQHCALVDCNNRYFLVNKDAAVFAIPVIKDIKTCQLLFELTVFKELENAIQTYSDLKSDLPKDIIEQLRTSSPLSLRAYMAEHYNACPRVARNMVQLLEYVNQQTSKYEIL